MCCLLGPASPLIACPLAQNQHHHPPAASRLVAAQFGPNGRQFGLNSRPFGLNSRPFGLNGGQFGRKPASIISHFLGRDQLRRLSQNMPDRPRVLRSAAELVWAGRKGGAGMGRLPGKHRIGARTARAACAWSDTYVENAAGAGGAARFDCPGPPRATFQFRPNQHQFCPNQGQFCLNKIKFGQNWGSTASNMHACGCAALLQPRQAWGWPALAPMCCHAPLPPAARLPLAFARGWLL